MARFFFFYQLCRCSSYITTLITLMKMSDSPLVLHGESANAPVAATAVVEEAVVDDVHRRMVVDPKVKFCVEKYTRLLQDVGQELSVV